MNDLLFTQGQDNLAGLVGELYIAPNEDILTLPDLAAATSLITAVADIVMQAGGKKFARIYFTDETGKMETKTVGERDGKARETMLTIRYPKLGVALADFIRSCQNTPSTLIVKMAATGKLYLVGVTHLVQSGVVLSKEIPAYFEAGEATSGEKRADQNGALLSWKFTCGHDPIEYAGTVPLTPSA